MVHPPVHVCIQLSIYPPVHQIEKLMALAQYYGVWKPPPTNQRLDYIQHELIPKIK